MFKNFLKSFKVFKQFSIFEWILWMSGLALIAVGFVLGFFVDENEPSVLSFMSSLMGLSCIIFCAKGNPIGQMFGVVFAILYSIYAFTQKYYGETIIYLAVQLPLAIGTFFTWLKNQSEDNSNEAKVNKLPIWEYCVTIFGAAALAVGFYFLLKVLNTDNLIVSSISLATGITAKYLGMRRCRFFSVFFIINDTVMIILWALKLPTSGITVLPSVLAFIMFFVTDTYCLINWQRILIRQRKAQRAKELEKSSPVIETPPVQPEEVVE